MLVALPPLGVGPIRGRSTPDRTRENLSFPAWAIEIVFQDEQGLPQRELGAVHVRFAIKIFILIGEFQAATLACPEFPVDL